MPLERVSQGFKDISMTFQRNPLNGDLLALKNESAIARSIRNIVFTVPGEKFFDQTFGSRITASLFENIDDISAISVADEIRESITRYEPRVNLISVNAIQTQIRIHLMLLFYMTSLERTFHHKNYNLFCNQLGKNDTSQLF